MALSAEEFTDETLMRYGLIPPNLSTQCNGCGTHTSLMHTLTCRTGGLIIKHHDEIHEVLGLLAIQAYGNSAVQCEPSLGN